MDQDKPKLEDLKYLGTMYGRNAWGNEYAEKALNWLRARLVEEMEKNIQLELENAKKKRPFWPF